MCKVGGRSPISGLLRPHFDLPLIHPGPACVAPPCAAKPGNPPQRQEENPNHTPPPAAQATGANSYMKEGSMDWMNVEPDKYNLLTKHYTPGRGGAEIEFVTLHHMAMIGDIDDCVRVWQDRPASAHYAISPTGMIGQAVNDSDTAWSNANLWSNQRSISIEHSNSAGSDQDWPISEATREAGAHLVAALCRYYKLGRPESGKNVRFHNIESGGSTACPYHLRPGHKYHDQYIRRAQYWYDQMTGKTAPKKSTGGSSVTMNAVEQVNAHTRAFISGFFGPQIDALQEIWTQLRGPKGKGWPQLGVNDKGQNLTLVDAVAALRSDVARIEKKLEER